MAVNIVEEVSIKIKQGNVDTGDFTRALEQTLQKEFANISKAKRIIAPDIKVDAKFDASKTLDKLTNLLSKAKLDESATKSITDQIAKIRQAVEQLNNTKVSLSGLKDLKKIEETVLGLHSGKVNYSDLSASMKQKVEIYKNHLQELDKVSRQINRQLTNVNAKVVDPVASAALSNLKTQVAAAKAEVVAAGQAIKEIKAQHKVDLQSVTKENVADIVKRHNAALNDAIAKQSQKQNTFLSSKEAYETLKSQTRPTYAAGALVSADLGQIQSNMTRFLKFLNSITSETAAASRARTEAQNNAIFRGNQARAQYPDVSATPAHLISDRRAAAQYHLEGQRANLNTITGLQINERDPDLLRRYAQQARVAQESIHRLGQELHQLQGMAVHTHPIIERLGNLFSRFAQYGIGYAALYKVTQGFNELAAAVINFEDKLKTIQAITGATNSDITALASTAKKVAETTGFDLNQITDAIKVISQAGVALKDIPETTQSVVNLATASGAALTTAADVITTAKAVWDEVDVTTIGDRITQAANVSKLAVEDLQTILSLEASSAKANNLSLDQTLALIATLRNKGIKPSTIATGVRQLSTELFSPDRKFTEFLSQQYASVGENVSAKEAANKFANFRNTDDPILHALQELVRIGVRSAEAQSKLSRAVDIRSLNVLRPALDSLGDLPATQARLVTAPTAAEAAKIAMDSLRKSWGNLGDATVSLTDTIVKSNGVLDKTQSFVKVLTKWIHEVDKSVKEADLQGNNIVADGLTTGAAVGIAAKFNGKSVIKSLLTALGVGGYVAAGESSKNNTISTTAEIAGEGFAAYSVYKTLPRILEKIKEFWAGGPAGLRAAAAGSEGVLASLIARGGIIAVGAATIGSVIAEGLIAAFAAKGIWDLLQRLAGKTSSDKVSSGDFLTKLSDDRNEYTKRFQESAKYRDTPAGKEAGTDSYSGLYEKYNSGTSKLVSDFEASIGVPAGSLQGRSEEVIQAIVKAQSDNLKSANPQDSGILKSLGKTFNGKPVSYDSLNALGAQGSSLLSYRQGLVDDIFRKRSELLKATPEPGTFEAQQKAILDGYVKDGSKFSGTARQVYAGNPVTDVKALEDLITNYKTAMAALASTRTVDAKSFDLGQSKEVTRQALLATGKDQEELLTELSRRVQDLIHVYGAEVIPVLKANTRELVATTATNRDSAAKVYDVFGGARTAAEADVSKADISDFEALTSKLILARNNLQEAKSLSTGDADTLNQLNSILPAGGAKPRPNQRYQQYAGLISDVEKERGLPPGFLTGIINTESKFDAGARGKVTKYGQALGIAQFIDDDTAKAYGVNDRLDPNQSIKGAGKYLQELLTTYNGDLSKAAAGYNYGPGNLNALIKKYGADWINHLPTETKGYLQSVLPFASGSANASLPFTQDNLSKIGTRNQEGRIIGNEFARNAIQAGDRNAQVIDPLEAKQFVPSDQYEINTREINRLEEEISHLRSTQLEKLTGKDSLFFKKRDLLIANKQEELAHTYNQPADEAHQDEKAKLIKNIKLDIDEIRHKAELELQTASDELAAKNAQAVLKTIEEKLAELQKFRDEYAKLGNPSKVAEINAQIATTLEDRKNAEDAVAKATKVGADQQNLLNEALARRSKSQQDLLGVDAALKAQAEQVDFIKSLPFHTGSTISRADYINQGRNEVIGTAPSIAQQKTRLQEILNQYGSSISANEASISSIGVPKDEASRISRDKLIKANNDLALEFARTAQSLADFDATVKSEIEQVSSLSIASKLQQLPDAMKNLSLNLENRVVTFVDSVATQMSDAAIRGARSLLGFGLTVEQMQQKISVLQDLWGAQGNQALVTQQTSIDLAQQIASIRQNETDPARQEFLIQQAQLAANQSQSIAQSQVDAAQTGVDKYNYDNSILGTIGNSATDLITGAAGDIVKSTIIDGFKNLLGTGEKGTDSDPLVVRFVKGVAKDASSGASGLVSGISDFFGFGTPTPATDQITPSLSADAIGNSIDNSLKDSGLSTLGDTLSTGNQELLSGLGSTFDSFTARLSTVFSLNNAASQVKSGLDIAKSVIGIASSVTGAFGGFGSGGSGFNTSMPSSGSLSLGSLAKSINFPKYAKGGMVSGPGTSTSDSIPTMLSNGEFVMSAAAVRAIGPETLARMNEFHKTPLRRAAGGLIGSMQQNLQSSQAQMISPQTASPNVTVNPEVSIRNILVDDQRNLSNFLSSSTAEKLIIGHLRNNQMTLKQLAK